MKFSNGPYLIQDEDCEAGEHRADHATGEATDPRFPARSVGNWILRKKGSMNLNEAPRRDAPCSSRNKEDQRDERNVQRQPIDRIVSHHRSPPSRLRARTTSR